MELVQELRKIFSSANEVFGFYQSLTEFEKMVLRRSDDVAKTVREIQGSRMSLVELVDEFLEKHRACEMFLGRGG